jgi:hypothetical protein
MQACGSYQRWLTIPQRSMFATIFMPREAKRPTRTIAHSRFEVACVGRGTVVNVYRFRAGLRVASD